MFIFGVIVGVVLTLGALYLISKGAERFEWLADLLDRFRK